MPLRAAAVSPHHVCALSRQQTHPKLELSKLERLGPSGCATCRLHSLKSTVLLTSMHAISKGCCAFTRQQSLLLLLLIQLGCWRVLHSLKDSQSTVLLATMHSISSKGCCAFTRLPTQPRLELIQLVWLCQVLHSLKDISSAVPMASMHSISKGFYGECGRRGGYLELTNFPDEVLAELGKLASISLCSNVAGQLGMAIVMKPPKARLLLVGVTAAAVAIG